MAKSDDNADGTLFVARANDCVKDELWLDWVKRNREGPDPDTFTPEQIDHAFAELVRRQKNEARQAQRR